MAINIFADVVWLTTKDFTVLDSEAALEKEVNLLINDNDSQNYRIEEIENIQSSNTWIALLSSTSDADENMQYAHLEKNWRNRYKIIAVGSVADMTYLDIDTNQGLFGVLVGRNIDLSGSSLAIKTMGDVQLESTFDIEGQAYFVKYMEIEKGIYNTSPAEFTLYDEHHQVVPSD